MLVGGVFETLRENAYIKWAGETRPAAEFLRHVRNGSFHGNSFDFRHGEPKRHAEWNGIVITKALQDTPVFFDFLDLGDAVSLIRDVCIEVVPS